LGCFLLSFPAEGTTLPRVSYRGFTVHSVCTQRHRELTSTPLLWGGYHSAPDDVGSRRRQHRPRPRVSVNVSPRYFRRWVAT
jgi:hypothetical protein